MLEERRYQSMAVEELRTRASRGERRLVLVAPTGSGKTAMACQVVLRAIAKGKRTYFLAHRRELIEQASGKLDDNGVDHGIIQAQHWRNLPHLPVQVASVQTLVRRMHHLEVPPDLLIVDECHRSTATTYRKIIDACPRAVLIGLTATPERSDGRGLGEVYDGMVQAATVLELLEHEPAYLVPPRVFAPSSPNLSGVHTRRGDYDTAELALATDKPDLIGNIVEHWRKLAADRLTVVFAVNVEHSQHIRDAFLAAGVPAEHVDGTTNDQERPAILQRWRAGQTRVVCNCEVLTEGFDLPAMSAVVLARPTQSVGLFLQMVGRGLRTYPGKQDCLILDHADAVRRHGFPQADRDWSLDANRRKGKPKETSVRICPQCFAAFKGPRCPECGFEMPVQSREITHVEGDLEELTFEQRKRQAKREQGSAKTLDDLIAVGQRRGYRNPQRWAQYVWAARQNRR